MELYPNLQNHIYMLEDQLDDFIRSSQNQNPNNLRKLARKTNQFYEKLFKEYKREKDIYDFMLKELRKGDLSPDIVSVHTMFMENIAIILNELIEDQTRELIPI